jgi:hypothetical protein
MPNSPRAMKVDAAVPSGDGASTITSGTRRGSAGTRRWNGDRCRYWCDMSVASIEKVR